MIFLGDIHGNYNTILDLLLNYNIEDSVIIQVGDFGLGFKTELNDVIELSFLDERLKEYNTILYTIRGNHDNPYFWTDKKYENYFSNINLVKDYSVINIEDLNILMIGGGISIDRKKRKKDISYWENENIIYKKKCYHNIDMVVTHVPPPFIFDSLLDKINLEYWLEQDETLKADIDEERSILDSIRKDVLFENKIKYWFSGHMHVNLSCNFDDIRYKLIANNSFYSHTIY